MFLICTGPSRIGFFNHHFRTRRRFWSNNSRALESGNRSFHPVRRDYRESKNPLTARGRSLASGSSTFLLNVHYRIERKFVSLAAMIHCVISRCCASLANIIVQPVSELRRNHHGRKEIQRMFGERARAIQGTIVESFRGEW